MTISDVVVHIDSSTASRPRLELALRMAREYSANLTGLYVIPTYDIPVYAEVSVGPEILEQGTQALREKARAVRSSLEDFIAKSGVAMQWHVVEGDLVRTLVEHARVTDLTIVGQGHVEDDEDVSTGLADRVVLESGAPVLVVPHAGWGGSLAKRVLIAWNGGRESARAVRDAIPLIKDAESAEILSIRPKAESTSESPGAEIAAHLARHGIDADTYTTTGKDKDAGAVLLERVKDTDRDLVVMGGYGHSRFRETILGGATRKVLREAAIPVFMSH